VLKLSCVAAVAVALSVPAATAAHQVVDTKRMVLQLADVPTGFERTKGRYVSNQQAAKESPGKNYAKLGRLTGYEADFKRSGSRIVGVLLITSSASVYKTARGASASLAASKQSARKARPPFRRLSLRTRLGNEAAMYVTTTRENGFKVEVYSIVWRSRNIFAAIIVGAFASTADPTQAVALAQKQQRRIAAATR
jgi:hypothetical protein